MRIISTVFQVAPSSAWTVIIDRYGVPFFLLCALGMFVWKVLWPFVAEQINASRAQVERTNNLLQEQLAASHTAREAALREFMQALERRDADFGKVVSTLEDLAALIEERRGRRDGDK